MTHSRFPFVFLALLILVGGGAVAPLHAQEQIPQAIGRMQTTDLSPDVVRRAQDAVQAPGKNGKSGPMSKIGQELALLYFQHQNEGQAGIRRLREDNRARKSQDRASGRKQSRVVSPLSENGRLVTVEAVATADGNRLRSELRRLGLENSAVKGNLVSGTFPISALRDAAQLSSLRGMVPSYARTHVGRVESEADTAHSSYSVREKRDVDGSGRKVCALSDSYNQDPTAQTSAQEDIQSGDLPGNGNPEGNTTPIDVLDDSEPGADEGRAMLQLIHDIAPGAELGFHTAFGGLATFAQGIRALADPNQGNCDIIVDDIGYNTEPFYQDGPVTNAVNDVVDTEDVAYFSSAGNDGQNAYHAPFRNSGESGVLNDGAEAHDFSPGGDVDTRQQITISAGGGEFGFFTFQWTDPWATVDGSDGPDTDLDVALVDRGDNVVAQSQISNVADGLPFETLNYVNEGTVDVDADGVPDSTFYLVIEKVEGPDPDEVRYVHSGSSYSIDEYGGEGATIYGHPMAEGAMAVAAAPFFLTSAYTEENPSLPSADPAILENFSSKGGIPIRFDRDGNSVSPIEREKPDVTGTDAIDNTFFGVDIQPAPGSVLEGVDPDPYPNFSGTSAAAPVVAGIAALIRDARPRLPNEDVYNRLESTAADVTQRLGAQEIESVAQGPDPWSGHGFVQAEDAVPPLDITDLQLAQTDPESGTVELSWQVRSGATIQDYEIERQYFSDAFETVDVPVTNQTAVFDNLGLGAYKFRVKWTRQDGVSGQRTISDTLGFQSIGTEVTETDDQGRSTVTLSWSVPQGTENYTYQIERRTGEQGGYRTVATTDETQFEFPRQLPGTYSYRVEAQDNRNQNNSLTSSTETSDLELEGAVAAVGPYPNPVEGDEVTFDLSVQNSQQVTLEVYNAIGERMYTSEPRVDALTPETFRLDVGRWGSGVYFLRLRGEEFTKTRKLVVVR